MKISSKIHKYVSISIVFPLILIAISGFLLSFLKGLVTPEMYQVVLKVHKHLFFFDTKIVAGVVGILCLITIVAGIFIVKGRLTTTIDFSLNTRALILNFHLFIASWMVAFMILFVFSGSLMCFSKQIKSALHIESRVEHEPTSFEKFLKLMFKIHKGKDMWRIWNIVQMLSSFAIFLMCISGLLSMFLRR